MKILRRLSIILFPLIVSCATHSVPNVEVCADLADMDGRVAGAYCKELNTDKSRVIEPDVWDDMIHNYLHISVPDMGELLKFIEKVCNRSKCKKKQIEQLYREFMSQPLYFKENHVI